MIIDKLENASRYFMLHPSLEQAFDFIESMEDDDFFTGKREIVGDHLYCSGISGETKGFDENIWEAHERYLDIHYVLEGKERVFFADPEEVKVKEAYNEEKDLTVYEGEGKEYHIPAGGFVIFFPSEIHKTMVSSGQPEPVKKLVIKLELA